jgi:cysteine desulfurase
MQSIAKIAKQNGALLHTDAVQALGKVEFLLQDTDIDFATISSHK